MYLPPQFREVDQAAIRAFISASRLGTLTSCGAAGAGLRASHVPMLLDPNPPPHGTLVCHLARGNEQWRDLARGSEALAIFLGPEAYVSPSAYASKREHGKVVPTWNYVAVHAYGIPRVIEDPDELHDIVTRLTDAHEAPRAEPWAVADAPEAFVASQLRGIVGVTLRVTRYDAKWKMSQNRTPEDVRGVIAQLRASDIPSERDTAEIVAEQLARRDRAPEA